MDQKASSFLEVDLVNENIVEFLNNDSRIAMATLDTPNKPREIRFQWQNVTQIYKIMIGIMIINI